MNALVPCEQLTSFDLMPEVMQVKLLHFSLQQKIVFEENFCPVPALVVLLNFYQRD